MVKPTDFGNKKCESKHVTAFAIGKSVKSFLRGLFEQLPSSREWQ
jgi:hypothetical protein